MQQKKVTIMSWVIAEMKRVTQILAVWRATLKVYIFKVLPLFMKTAIIYL
jgi:hypothetical protein